MKKIIVLLIAGVFALHVHAGERKLPVTIGQTTNGVWQITTPAGGPFFWFDNVKAVHVPGIVNNNFIVEWEIASGVWVALAETGPYTNAVANATVSLGFLDIQKVPAGEQIRFRNTLTTPEATITFDGVVGE